MRSDNYERYERILLLVDRLGRITDTNFVERAKVIPAVRANYRKTEQILAFDALEFKVVTSRSYYSQNRSARI